VAVWGTVINDSTQFAAFLGSMGSTTYDTSLGIATTFYSYGDSLQRHTGIQSPAGLPFSVLALLLIDGAGIFACFPSASPFGYTLGAD